MPATTKKLPTSQELGILARALAIRMAHNPTDVDDLSQEALLWCHNTFRRTPKPTKPFALARTVMQRAMITYYHKPCHRKAQHEEPLSAHTEHMLVPTYNASDDKLYFEQYFGALESMLGPMARRVAEDLLAPSSEEFCEFIIKETKQKNLRKTRITSQQLRRALGIKRSEWATIMRGIKGFTRTWLSIMGDE